MHERFLLFILMSVVTMAEARARKFYEFKFNQAVIKHAEENRNQEAARKYLVDGTAASIYCFFM